MKKLALICLSLAGVMPIVFGAVSAVNCNQDFYKTLRYGKQYTFRDEFNANSSDKWIWDYSRTYNEQYDYNNSASFPEFDWTDAIDNADYKVAANTTMSVIQATSPYQILSRPAQRSHDNLLLTYTIIYSTDEAGNHQYSHTECGHYEISRCGDGIVDDGGTHNGIVTKDYGEVCDPGDTTNKLGWGNGGCSNSCQPITAEQPVCNSTYNGQRVTNLSSSYDLCTKGTVGNFQFNESTHKWTWKCNNVAGQSVECSAVKPYCGDGIKDAGEACDYKDTSKAGWGNGGCSTSCTVITVNAPACSSSYNGQRLTSLTSSNSLCSEGTISNFQFNESTHKWTWKCNNTLGQTVECGAVKPYCGDGIKDAGEACDYRDSNKVGWSELGCNNSCQPITVPSGCDETFYNKLRYGRQYTFYDDFHANSSDKWLWKWVMEYNEQYDYNKSPDFPTFAWTTNIVNANYKVAANTTMRVLQATSTYPILAVPAQRAYDNLFIKYTITYSSDEAGTNKIAHSECAYYEITRCGDGVLDTEFGETCDPKDPTQTGWGNGGCDDSCQPITVAGPVCNSVYNGQTLEELPSEDKLCEVGEATDIKYDENTRTWTWKCNNVAGEGVNCSAKKKEEPKGYLDPLKTLIGTNEVTKIGDIIVWSLKVTAKDGDVTNFIMSDTMPPVLGYKDFEILHKGSVDNITFLGENEEENSVSWKVDGTLKEGDYVEIKLITYAKEMPKQEQKNVLCVRPENEENNKKCDDEPIPPVCSSEYNGETLEELPSEDKLCEVGEATDIKYDENTHKWTWRCVNKEGIGVNCSANKKLSSKGYLDPLKTLIGTNEVSKVGDKITWSLKVTARDGDVTDFIMSDEMPPVLGYEDFEILHKGSVDNITFLGENEEENSVSWKVDGTLKEGDYVEIKLITYAKEMPEEEQKNVLCVRPENEENNKKCDDEPIPPVCSSEYNGETLEELPSEDKLCEVGEATDIKYDEDTHKWTWKCVNKEGKSVSCWARKEGSKTSTGELKPLKTLIGTNEIREVNDEIKWSLKVTAKNGDVTNFIMSDEMPPVLGYTSYRVLHTGSVNDIIFQGWNRKNNTVSRRVDGTLKEDDYVEIELTTYAMVMPDKKYDNVLCVRPENEENNKECNDKPIPAPHIRIKKSFTDGDNVKRKKVKIGEEIGYKISFGNTGDASATITSIKDFLPKNVNYVTGMIYLNGGGDSYNYREDSGSEIIDILRGEKQPIHTAKTVQGVRVDIYTGITLRPGQWGYIIITGEVLEDNQDSTTNFACIYLNNNKIDCDNAKHDITPEEVMCKPIDGGKKNCPENDSWSVPVTCESSGGKAKIQLFCDDDLVREGNDITKLEWTCDFKGEGEHTAQCKVNDKEEDACKGTYKITKEDCDTPTQPRCKSLEPEDGRMVCRPTRSAYMTIYCDGKKVKQSRERETDLSYRDYESCKQIECFVSDSYLDGKNGDPCPDRNNEGEVKPQLCMNVNAGNFSIEEGEIFPFYWNLHNMDNIYKEEGTYTTMDGDYDAVSNYDKGGSCEEAQDGKIAKNSMVCEFNVYDGDFYHKGVHNGDPYYENPLYTIEGPCLSEESVIDKKPLIKARYNKMVEKYCNEDLEDCEFYGDGEIKTAVYYIENFGKGAKVGVYAGEFSDTWDLGGQNENLKSYGEYKIELSRIKYLQCEGGSWQQRDTSKEGTEENEAFIKCQNDFMLTNSYTVQKTPSGNIEASTTELNKYLSYNEGSPFTTFIDAIAPSDYKENDNVKTAMKNFTDKYEKLAVSIGGDGKIKKVPGKNIYFVYKNFDISDNTFEKAFTIIQKGVDKKVTINGNVTNLNMMILTEGDIEFKGDCTYDQTVKGIFYAGGNLSRGGSIQKNKDIDKGQWCTNGGLHIKGVLIGDGFKNLMNQSRSNINDWFISDASKRKGYVMNGASVVIEYSPSIFNKSTMPPGAEYFTTALDVYKK